MSVWIKRAAVPVNENHGCGGILLSWHRNCIFIIQIAERIEGASVISNAEKIHREGGKMTMSVSVIFMIMAVIFCLILILAGFSTKNWSKDAEDFSMAGREIGTIVGISAVIAISFAGSNLTLVPSFTITYGFKGAMLWCIPMSAGFIIYALFPGRFLRRCGANTLPEWLQMRYGKKTRTIVSVGSIVGLCGIMANNIASFSTLLTAFTGIPGWVSIVMCFLVMIIFTSMGGQWAVKITDFIQVIIGAVAIPLACFLIGQKAGWNFLTDWPGSAGWFAAGQNGVQLPILSLQYPSFLTFAVLNGFFLIWGSNYFFLTAACMRNEKVIRRSFITTALIQLPIVYLPLILIGLLAVCNTAEGFAPAGGLDPTAAFGVMLLNLGAAVAAFTMVSAMCASISTASTSLVAAQATATHDIYLAKINPEATPAQGKKASRFIVVIIGIVCLLLTFYPGGPTYLFAFSNAWMGPPAVLLLLGMYWPRITDKGALVGVSTGMVVMAVFTVLDLSGIFSIGRIMHVGVAGLLVTLGVTVAVSLMTKPSYYGTTAWRRNSEAGKYQDIELDEVDRSVLMLISSGMEYMAELGDYMAEDINRVNSSIEKLDQGGYICRDGLYGAKFYAFQLIERGEAAITSEKEMKTRLAEDDSVSEELAADGLTPEWLSFMAAVGSGSLEQYAEKNGFSGSAVVAVISMLDRKKMIVQGGFFRRTVKLTALGEEILNKYRKELSL